MVAYLEEQRSRAAIWCLRLAVFLIPFFVLVILLYRMPFGYQAFLAMQYPLANDVSTDMRNPPEYINAAELRASNSDKGMNQIIEYDDEYAKAMIIAYPRLQSRRYPAGPERVLEAVRVIIDSNEWLLTGSQGIPELKSNSETEETTELADNNTEDANQDSQLEDNVDTPDDIFIEVLERTFIFGFENDMVIRIVSEDRNTLVDARSSARWGRHDFGYNAKLIEGFLQQLDAALLGIAGEG